MQRSVGRLSEGVFDLLVVGGGITGAGVALDAARRGWRVAVIDKGDFASATSSASSKLVHGGIRYLEHGDFGLVYEALAERRRLLHNAPHLVHPLRFVLPFYAGARVPGWKYRVGLWLYDLLAGSHNLRHSRRVALPRLRQAFPGLRAKGLRGAAEYHDAQMDDARLCLEVVRTAWVHGAEAANYVEALGFESVGGRIGGAHVRDVLTGETGFVRARQVLNAAGPWVDAVCRMAGEPPGAGHLQPTKGVHIIVSGKPYAAGGDGSGRDTAFLLLHPADGRVFFVLPWMGHTLVGTTDTYTDESPDALRVLPSEVGYLLDGYNHHFAPGLRPEDVRGAFAGLRPLLRSDPKDPSAKSREFRVFEGPNGLLSVAGGKYTTYRHMAEVITDRVGELLGDRRRCRTADLKLDGAPAGSWEDFNRVEPAALSASFGIGPELAEHLIHRYGRRGREVAAVVAGSAELRRPVVIGEPDVRGEWVYQQAAEMAQTRADLVLRRSRIGMWHPELLNESTV